MKSKMKVESMKNSVRSNLEEIYKLIDRNCELVNDSNKFLIMVSSANPRLVYAKHRRFTETSRDPHRILLI